VKKITGVPKSHAVYLCFYCGWFHIRNETKKQLQCSPRETKRNETEMGEIDFEAPFRYIRFFSVSSATLSREARKNPK
jgi:hypothetical protein